MKLIEILKAFEFVNPKLISDGGGVYSDVYQMGDEDAVELEAAILDFQATPKAVTDGEIYSILIDNDQHKYFVEGAEELAKVLTKWMQGKLTLHTLSSDALYCTTCKSTFNRGLNQDYCPSCNYYSLKRHSDVNG